MELPDVMKKVVFEPEPFWLNLIEKETLLESLDDFYGYADKTKMGRFYKKLMKAIDECPIESQWISVHDELPPYDEWVFVYTPDATENYKITLDKWLYDDDEDELGETVYDNPDDLDDEDMMDGWLVHHDIKQKITHWCPIFIPPLPRVEKNENED